MTKQLTPRQIVQTAIELIPEDKTGFYAGTLFNMEFSFSRREDGLYEVYQYRNHGLVESAPEVFNTVIDPDCWVLGSDDELYPDTIRIKYGKLRPEETTNMDRYRTLCLLTRAEQGVDERIHFNTNVLPGRQLRWRKIVDELYGGVPRMGAKMPEHLPIYF